MKRALAIVVLIVVALPYAAGFWPEHRRLIEVQTQLETVHNRSDEARSADDGDCGHRSVPVGDAEGIRAKSQTGVGVSRQPFVGL